MTAPLPLSGLRVLVVEDVPEQALAITSTLRREGGASPALEASASMAQKRLLDQSKPAFNLAIIDHQLCGDMDGTRFATWLRDEAPKLRPDLDQIVRISYSTEDRETILAEAPDPDIFHAILNKAIHPVDQIVSELSHVLAAHPIE